MRKSTRSGLHPLIRMRLRVSVRVRSEEGTSLLEFAVALPVVGILLVSIIWSGITFYDYVVLADAVGASARELATARNFETTTDNGCQMAESTLMSGTQTLNQANITMLAATSSTLTGQTLMAPYFAGTTGLGGAPATTAYYSTCSNLLLDDTAVVGAAYACNLPIPFTSMNLCPLANGSPIQATVTNASGSSTVTLGTCPFAHCISSITTVRIE